MITVAYPYYNSPKALSFHLDNWINFSKFVKQQVRFLIVDDGSKQSPYELILENSNGINIELYRITKDIPWNWTGVRNLIFTVTKTQWTLHTDIDYGLSECALENLITSELSELNFYRIKKKEFHTGEWVREHKDTFIMTKEQFWSVGGYDEDFAGWYGRATYVFYQELKKKFTEKKLDNVWNIHYDAFLPDSQANLGRKGSKYDIKNNPQLMKKRHEPKNPLRFEWKRLI